METVSKSALKRLSQIGDRKYHSRHGEYLVEGISFVEEAFRARAGVQELVCQAGKGKAARVSRLIELAEEAGAKVWQVGEMEMSRICRTMQNQGVAAGIALNGKSSGDIFGEMLQYSSGTILLLDGVQDPGNVGTMIRTAEAFGIAGIILGHGSAGLYNTKTIRGTMGAIFRMVVAEMQDRKIADIVARFKESGFRALAANVSEAAVPINKILPGKKDILIIGSEAAGISRDTLALVDTEIVIPMPGPTESLNASIAGGIIMFRLLSK